MVQEDLSIDMKGISMMDMLEFLIEQIEGAHLYFATIKHYSIEPKRSQHLAAMVNWSHTVIKNYKKLMKRELIKITTWEELNE